MSRIQVPLVSTTATERFHARGATTVTSSCEIGDAATFQPWVVPKESGVAATHNAANGSLEERLGGAGPCEAVGLPKCATGPVGSTTTSVAEALSP
jgi:hypothetical protein